jgi:hypothetical protein
MRQHDVDDGHVVRAGGGEFQPPRAVGGDVHGEPRLGQPLGHEIGNRPVVLDDE